MNCVASASRGKGIDRVSLPPPHYGAASFSTPKASRSGSFQPSAPSSSTRDPVSRTTHSGSQASENHVRTKITYLQSYYSVVRCLCGHYLDLSTLLYRYSFAQSALRNLRIWHLVADTRYNVVCFDILKKILHKYILDSFSVLNRRVANARKTSRPVRSVECRSRQG